MSRNLLIWSGAIAIATGSAHAEPAGADVGNHEASAATHLRNEASAADTTLRLPVLTTVGASPASGAGPGSAPFPAPAAGLGWEGGAALTRTLAAELARASAQGLLEPREDLPDLARADSPPDVQLSAEEQTLGDATVRFTTGIDRALERASRAETPPRSLTSCLRPEALDVPAWAAEGTPAQGIAALRSRLLLEFDEPDPSVVLSLARLFIHLSFGAEARQVLETYPTGDPDEAVLLDLAALMDGDNGAGAVLASQAACGGFATLWSFLAGADAGPEMPRVEDVLYSFSALPPHLRRNLAPRLAERLAEAGEADAVDVVVASVARVATADDPALVLAKARGPASALAPRSEDDGLMRLARTVHPEASAALLLQIEDLVALGRAVPADLVDTAAILSYERAGTEDGSRLKAAEIAAQTTNGAFLHAFDELAQGHVDGSLSGELFSRGRDRLLEAATQSASDSEIARIAFDPRFDEIVETAPAALRQQVADRVLGIGFGARAAELAPRGDAAPGGLFLGRVARATGDPETALALARTADGPAAASFIADTLSQLSRHDEAAAQYDRAGARPDALDEAWRAGDWDRLAAADESPRARAAAIMAGLARDPLPAPEPSSSLAVADRLIDDSAALRQTLQDLLSPPGNTDG